MWFIYLSIHYGLVEDEEPNDIGNIDRELHTYIIDHYNYSVRIMA